MYSITISASSSLELLTKLKELVLELESSPDSLSKAKPKTQDGDGGLKKKRGRPKQRAANRDIVDQRLKEQRLAELQDDSGNGDASDDIEEIAIAQKKRADEKSKARKKKSEANGEDDLGLDSPMPAPAAKLTLENVKLAAKEFINRQRAQGKEGMSVLAEILAQHGARKFSDLESKDYEAVVRECRKR